MDDYNRIAMVIRYIEKHHTEQPSLEKLASVADLSPSHFHRLFHRWAGVTPKKFLQGLTAEHAKLHLKNASTVLETTIEVGLSSPGRLHDLLVNLEAASPGEIKRKGEDSVVCWGYASSHFGSCSLGWSERGFCHLAFCEATESPIPPVELRELLPEASFQQDDEAAQRWCSRVFQEKGQGQGLQAFVRATPFQFKVWQALLRIPEGRVVSYGGLARMIGQPKAARAVGHACSQNPIAYLIPCHRVLRETGVTTGYRWGATRKKAILAYELLEREEVLK
jgi:AraC family transcriptional regulator, regulatory protein of adaptative response / methylated-DNA-[protein]-cysteine methyltransferase